MSKDVEEVWFQPGEILFRENEQSFHFFIIQEGEVEIFKSGKTGGKITLALVGPGASIGEFAMIDRLPRSASAVAKTRLRAAKVSDEAYQQLIGELPDWAISVMRSLVERLRQTNEIVRALQLADENALRQIERIEYESEGTITESTPDLKRPEEE